MIRLRYLLLLLIIMMSAAGWGIYSYLFDATVPKLDIKGLENSAYYSGDIACTICSDKKGQLCLTLDDKVLCENYAVRAHQEYPFTIPTATLPHGQHNLKVTVTDIKWYRNKATAQREFVVDNVPLQAALVKTEPIYKVLQGRTLHLQLQANKPIKKAVVRVFAQEYEFFPESLHSSIYETFVPVECEQSANEYLFEVTVEDNVGNQVQLEDRVQVVLFPFKKTTMVISEEKMKEEEKLGADNYRFEQLMEEITQNSPRQKLWRGTFTPPIDVTRVTCEYGTVRTTQRKGRYAHKALDVVSTPGCVVWAPQDGIIVMKERFAFNGNTVVIDHGWGIVSIFCHLKNFANIKVGDKIAQGNPIGTMGKTGYATGEHVHWEMRIKGIAIDPMQWTKVTF